MMDGERTDPGASTSAKQVVSSLLDRVRRRWSALAWLRAGCRAAVGAAVVILLVALADRLGAPVDLALVLLAAGGFGLAAGVAWRLLRPARRSPSDAQVARYIEEHYPELEDRLASASDPRATGPESQAFAELVVAEAARQAGNIDATTVVGTAALRGATLRMVGAAACLAGALFLAGAPASRALQVVWLHLFPGAFSIDVQPGDVSVVAGEPLTIRAAFHGGLGSSGGSRPQLVVDDGVATRSVEMAPNADGDFAYEVPAVEADFSYRVDLSTASSAIYRVVALFPPNVEQIDVYYDYPKFTGLEPRTEEDAGDVYAPVGTRVRMTVRVDKAVAQAAMVMADGQRVELTPTADGELEGGLDVERDGSYRIALLDTDGLSNSGTTEYFIRVMDDRPPEVRIVRPGGDREITPLEEVTIEARADDDYGVDRFELVYSVRGGPERAVPLGSSRGAATVTGSRVLYVEDLSVQPGDFITYYARARDVSRAKRSTESRSDIFFLEVKPFEEEFVNAQSQAMGGGGGGSLEELVAAQKAVIVATWKLERRSTGGRSAEDIRAVGRAQGELKERAAAAAAEDAGPRRGRRGATVGEDATAESPMQLAVVAMGQAEAALGDLHTKEALPSEMEALNQLLKADAEIRRRQVTRRQAQGGGGSSGAQQDLSALFDRELQRQQETNYETPSSGSQEGQEPESEALRKVRELARRQDELSRQQRELARQQASMTQEELRRRLERLTREQSELREQAEELSRQLAREQGGQQGQADSQQQGQQAQAGPQTEGGQSAGGQQGGGGSSGERQMRGISEEMQRATSELRRDDPSEASRRADQALAGLREIERELLGGQPEQQRRALGELQLESQQVADAQRRLAGEARQLTRESSTATAVRRLADEREALAERVDDLARRVGELGRNMSAEQGDALSEAAATLEREAVSERMRDSAASLRATEAAMAQGEDGTSSDREAEEAAAPMSPTEADRLARTDAELTQTLDDVARRLGESASQQDEEARRLSEQLAKSNELRERLRSLQERLDQLNAAGSPQTASGARADGTSQGQPSQSGGAEGAGGGQADMANLEQAYRDELRETLQMMEELQQESAQLSGGRGTPETQQFSLSAPGTEAFKQDYAAWDALRRDVTLALEQLEESLTQRLNEKETEDRLNAGADQRMPETYRNLVSKYYQALAAKKRN